MKEMLNFYGWETIEEAAKALGLSIPSAKQAVLEMYEDDTAPDQ